MTELRAAISSGKGEKKEKKRNKKLSLQGCLTNARLSGDHRSLLYHNAALNDVVPPLPLRLL